MAKDNPERAARLAEALRANLKRRKAQARAQEDGERQSKTDSSGLGKDR